MATSHLVISCSLREGSRSAVLAHELAASLTAGGGEVRELDLRRVELPLCGLPGYSDNAQVQAVRAAIEGATTVTIATPIYNFEVGGATRNLVAVTGSVWKEKVVGFLCAAGGRSSYMSVMGLANSLMLDFRCIVVPRFVYATGGDFEEERLVDQEVQARLADLAGELERLANALGATAT